MITLTHDFQTDYAALADILGADVVDAALVMMGNTSCTWQRLALYASGTVGDSDSMEDLAGLAVVLPDSIRTETLWAIDARIREFEKAAYQRASSDAELRAYERQLDQLHAAFSLLRYP